MSEGPDGHMGLMYHGSSPDTPGYGVKKLSYYTCKKLAETLKGSAWDAIETVREDEGIYVYKFTQGAKPIWVAWNDNPESRLVIIPGIRSARVKVTLAVPDCESGKAVSDYSNAFKSEIKAVDNGKISIALGEIPVYIE